MLQQMLIMYKDVFPHSSSESEIKFIRVSFLDYELYRVF
jgi:hypothetical protein